MYGLYVGWGLPLAMLWVCGLSGAAKANSNKLDAAVVDAAGSAAALELSQSEQHAYFHAQREASSSHEARRKLREWSSVLQDGGDPTGSSAPGEHAHDHGHKHGGHQCVHDLIMNSMAAEHHYRDNQAPQEYDLSDLPQAPTESAAETESAPSAGRRLQSSSSFSTIRIHLDTSSLDAAVDRNAKGQSVACYTAGQSYTPTLAQRQNEVSICDEDDILTPEKKAYLVNTILKEAVEWFE
jgi:hypothetical protein